MTFSQHFQRVEIVRRHLQSFFKLVLQLGRRAKLQIGIVASKILVDEVHPLKRFQRQLEQYVVVAQASPTLAIVAVRDVELRLCVAAFRIGEVLALTEASLVLDGRPLDQGDGLGFEHR